ncbi:uncharacterized protein LOC115832429, partial [Nomascus leucogenys]|uniref:uncharacterized protein LOC115832429 n=1 Tax=Nomascus leucogenys TaxID=61853 RepID=UPI00122D6CF2
SSCAVGRAGPTFCPLLQRPQEATPNKQQYLLRAPGLAGGSAQSRRALDTVLCHSGQQQGLSREARGSVRDPCCHCGAGRADWPGPPELDVCVEEAEGEAPWTWTGLCIFATLFLLSVSYSAAITLLMVQRFLSATRQGRPQTSLDSTNILQPPA